MRSKKTHDFLKAVCIASVILAIGAMTGCATEPSPLDKTQTESVHKKAFDGEWYFKITVTDTEWHNQYNFIGEEAATYMGAATKIRWEITQDYLNGYMMPQMYRDLEGNMVENLIGSKSLIFSFRIEKHFDIKYLQNNTTREELNVIIENTDRPWNEREYMIVDWSKNLATNFWAPLVPEIEAGEVVLEPMSTWKSVEFFDVNDNLVNTKAWRPGKDPDIYVLNIDIQQQIHPVLQSPWQIYYDHMEPAVIKFRFSLMKKNAEGRPVSQYQPLQYRDEFFRRFGFFRTEYETYDPDRGPLESQKQYLINRWDVSCHPDPDNGGQTCKTIVFYLSPSSPTAAEDPDLFQWSQDVVNAWNAVLQEATGRTDTVVELRENEPLLDKDGNPVLDIEGQPRYKYELGDIRYNFINFVRKPNSAAPLGYGPSVSDPDTGEIINGTVNIYANWVEYVMTRTIDLYDVVAGNCSMDEIMSGYYFNEQSGQCDGGNPGITAKDSKTRKMVDMNFLTPAMRSSYWPKVRTDLPTPAFDKQFHEAARPMIHELVLDQMRNMKPADLGKFSIAAGTEYERKMIPSATFGSTFTGASSVDQVLDLFATSHRLSESNLVSMKNYILRREKHGVQDPDHYEKAILAFVQEMAGRPREEVKQTLRRWIYFTCILHEMGHTLGLRHNFRASTDRRNFPEEYQVEYDNYWTQVEALRAQYGQAIKSGDAEAYEAYVNAVNRIPSKHDRYASSSIMDYLGDWEAWVPYVLSYDRAALLFGYGLKVEIKQNDAWQVVDFVQGDFKKDSLMDFDAPSESGRVVRYYQVCSDERQFDDMFCSPFDRGTTATEIVQNMIRDQYKSYFFTNFKRDSAMFDARRSGYYWRKWLRNYYIYAKAFAQITVNNIWYDQFWSSMWDGIEAIAQGPEARDMVPGYMPTGGEDLLRASLLYYYYLLYDVLGRPDYGLHRLTYDAFGNRYWESTDPQYVASGDVTASIDAGPGWGWIDKWDSQYDTTVYYDKLIRIGVELDKIIAYEVLSIPAALNDYLWHEKANGNTYWSDLWTANGIQLWRVTRGIINDVFAHEDNPWCMDEQGNMRVQPVDMLEGMAWAGFINQAPFTGDRCPAGSYPVQPGMDALYAIYPIFYGLSGAQHPWYHNHLSDYMDSQVKGGNHRFDIPAGAEYVEFTNSTGTKTYQAVQSDDGLSISYQLVDKGRQISNRIRMAQACDAGEPVTQGLPGTHDQDCDGVLACYYGMVKPDYCDPQGWNSIYLFPALAYRDLDRVESMLIMMQDMIDLAGHYAWRTPGYLENP